MSQSKYPVGCSMRTVPAVSVATACATVPSIRVAAATVRAPSTPIEVWQRTGMKVLVFRRPTGAWRRHQSDGNGQC